MDSLPDVPSSPVLSALSRPELEALLVELFGEVAGLKQMNIRCYVTRRKVSAGTRSEVGRDSRDAFLGLIKTCDKRVVEALDPCFKEGFHSFETDNGFRWTDGNALLPTELFINDTAGCQVELHVAATTRYRMFGVRERVAA